MRNIRKSRLAVVLAALVTLAATISARAEEVIKVGLSVPLSGSAANWGRGVDWMCKKAAEEIKAAGGIKVKGKAYNIECLAYDNKYTAADGIKVAQTLLNRDGVKYIYVLGTAPILATQSITERQGVMLFNTSWGMSSKGPKFPLTISVDNSPNEIMPALIKYLTQTFPQAKTMVILNANDATGREAEATARPMWEKAGMKILTSDFYERGTTEFQPIAARLVSFKPDMVDLSTVPMADAGQVFKELDALGFKGIKVTDNGTGADAIIATGGTTVNGVYMGASMTFDGASTTEHQRKVNDEYFATFNESLGLPQISGYDAIYMLKAGAEKAQSIDPKDVAAVLETTTFRTFYGGEAGFGGKEIYGVNSQPMLPVYITQLTDGKLIEKARIVPTN